MPVQDRLVMAEYFSDTSQHQNAYRIIHHWLVVNRHELLADTFGDRIQSCTTTACENYTFHINIIYYSLFGKVNH